MDMGRSSHLRASASTLVALAVMASASSVHAQEAPASSAPNGPPADNSSPTQPATGSPAPPLPAQGGGYPQPYSYQGRYGAPPFADPPAGYVRLPPPHVHDGFYLRMHLGFGFTSLEGKDGLGNHTTISGDSTSLGLALGAAVAPNLIVFGGFMLSIAEQPGVSDGQGTSITVNGSAGLYGLGAGVVYYVQRLNLYLSGALAGMQLELTDANNRYESKFGLGFQGMVGKEWWVSSEWGLGLAVEAILAGSMRDQNDSSITWSGKAASLLFSATYN